MELDSQALHEQVLSLRAELKAERDLHPRYQPNLPGDVSSNVESRQAGDLLAEGPGTPGTPRPRVQRSVPASPGSPGDFLAALRAKVKAVPTDRSAQQQNWPPQPPQSPPKPQPRSQQMPSSPLRQQQQPQQLSSPQQVAEHSTRDNDSPWRRLFPGTAPAGGS